MVLSRNNSTDLTFWLSQPLAALRLWIKANNAIVEDGKEGGNGR